METIWIIGLGRFGREAVRRLHQAEGTRRLVLIDADAGKLRDLAAGASCEVEHGDGVDVVARRLTAGEKPDWIVPAVPVHLAAEWCLRRSGPSGLRRGEVPQPLLEVLPNPVCGATGDVYVSHARFRCPPDCEEPRDFCTVTHEPRKRDMFELLAELKAPSLQPLVLRSHQLGAGVGGYRPEQMMDLLNRVRAARTDLLVSTACRCHAVVTAVCRA